MLIPFEVGTLTSVTINVIILQLFQLLPVFPRGRSFWQIENDFNFTVSSTFSISAVKNYFNLQIWSRGDFEFIRQKIEDVLPYSHYFYRYRNEIIYYSCSVHVCENFLEDALSK